MPAAERRQETGTRRQCFRTGAPDPRRHPFGSGHLPQAPYVVLCGPPIDRVPIKGVRTPTAFVQGSADIVSGEAPTAALPVAADRTWQRLIMSGATVAGDATIDGGSSIVTGAIVGTGAVVRSSVVMDGARIEPGARVERAVVGRGAVIGAGTLSSATALRWAPDANCDTASGSGRTPRSETVRSASLPGRDRLNRRGPTRVGSIAGPNDFRARTDAGPIDLHAGTWVHRMTGPTRPRPVRILRRFVSVVCWATLAVAGAMVVGRQIGWKSEWAVSAVVFAPYAALAAAGGEVGLLCLRAWRSAIVGALVLGLAAWGQVGAFLPAERPTDLAGLTVMTTNLRLGQADPGVVVSLAAEHDVDVLAVQELTDSAAARLHRAGLDRLLPYRIIAPRVGGAGVGLWSRQPMTDATVLPGFGFDPVCAHLTVAGRSYTVMSFHSKAPLYNGGTGPWESDLRRLSDVMADLPAPLVVAGDFNATRDHRQFRDLLNSKGYRDAGDDAGAGLLPTFPADRGIGPFAGIDHVVFSGDLVGVAAKSAAVSNSDHYAVIAQLAPR